MRVIASVVLVLVGTTSTPPGNAFRVVPIAGCTAIGTCEPGGCASEDICTWTNN